MDKHEVFLEAIQDKKKVKIKVNTFEKGMIERTCVPFDFHPLRRSSDTRNRYHFWDIDSPDGSHNLPVLPEQLIEIEILDETFDPADFVTWSPINWAIPRDWGDYS